MIFAQQSSSYESAHDTGITGLVGIFEAMVVDNQGAIVTASSAAGIVETPAGSGIYAVTRIAPAALGQYSVIGSTDGSYDPGTVSVDDLIVTASAGGVPLSPLEPVGQESPVSFGPCSLWTSEDDVAACCQADVGSDTSVYADSVQQASELLYPLSGRIFAGSCQSTARPCRLRGGCGTQVLSRGHIVWNGASWWGDSGPVCGCGPDSEVLLSGYPVREIVEVTIDGDVVDPGTYEIRGHRWLARMDDPLTGESLVWPSCQNTKREPTEEGTFAITYLHGSDPPLAGQLAAAELACEIYKACAGEECALPSGTTRVARQGVVVELLAFSAWGLQDGIWRTGLKRTDSFLNAYARQGLTRRPAVWAPGGPRYARRVG